MTDRRSSGSVLPVLSAPQAWQSSAACITARWRAFRSRSSRRGIEPMHADKDDLEPKTTRSGLFSGDT